MRLAIKEIMHSKKKYFLIELVVVLLIFMVLFLSGLVNGLGRAISSAIDYSVAQYYLIEESSEDLITTSNLDTLVLDKVKNQTKSEVAPLNIQRMYITKSNSDTKMNIVYFAIEPGSFLEPDIYKGEKFSKQSGDEIILDDDFELEGISIGDKVFDSSTSKEFTVIGFTKDKMYGHVSVGYISMEGYTDIRKTLNANYKEIYNTIAVKDNSISNINIEGTKIDDKATIIEHLPAYKAESMTINMVIWVLVFITVVILGVFNYILVLQKEKQFAVMKAMGIGMNRIVRMIIGEVTVISVCAVVVANILNFIMASMLPQTMPYYLILKDVCITSIAFVIMSIFGALLSTHRVSKVDPMIVIGGEQ